MSTMSSGTRQVSIFVPALVSGLAFLNELPNQELPTLPATQLFFTRTKKIQDGFENYFQGVCSLLGITSTDSNDLPLAAMTLAAENNLNSNNNSDYFIFAEPVVMRADRDSVVLVSSLIPVGQVGMIPENSNTAENNALSLEESVELIEEINLHFSDEPWKLKINTNGAWYLILSSKFDIQTINISSVLLKNTQEFSASGNDARYWRKIINEIEMLLFSSKVNESRMGKNKLTVTSLWLWGGGKIPEIHQDKNILVYAEDNFMKSVSKFTNSEFKLMSQSSTALLKFSETVDHVIMLDTELQMYWQQRDIYSWLEALKKIEINLIQPLLDILRKGEIDSISLYQDNNTRYYITRSAIRRWWLPVKSLDKISSRL